MRTNNDYGFISYTDNDASEDLVQLGVQRTAADTADLIIYTNSGNTSATERLRITSDGNLKFSTAGTGIDFSATSDGSGTMTSELLDDYEEGTWTPTFAGNSGASGQVYSLQQGHYVKIGRLVTLRFNCQLSTKGTFVGSFCKITNFPFTATSSDTTTSGGTPLYHVGLNSNVILLACQVHEGTSTSYLWVKTTSGPSREYKTGNQLFGATTQLTGVISYETDS